MPKNTAYVNYLRALSGVASVLGSASSPSISVGVGQGGGGGGLGMTTCDTCNLNLPRSATHADVLSHPCYRGFSITLTAAGQISLA